MVRTPLLMLELKLVDFIHNCNLPLQDNHRLCLSRFRAARSYVGVANCDSLLQSSRDKPSGPLP